MRFTKIFTLLFLLVASVVGDVSISKPTKGSSYTVSGGNAQVEISWEESNATPKLSDIEEYSFTICTGPNTDINGLQTIKKITASDVKGNSYTLSIPSNVGADGSYYVQVYATTKNGYTIHYSQRFTLQGMTGSKKPSGGDEVAPPAGQTSVNAGDQTSTLAPSDLSKSHQLFYTSQTGLTRYAPMQTQPGSTITASTWSRRYQTSSVSYFSTLKHSAQVLSTKTQDWSYTMSSAVNYASPAPDPSVAGWYNPSSKITPASLSSFSSGSDASSSKK
ncbi:hypothetical protein WICANDRAFT_36961 [Wickerhamomyces anomalus NRRL Y-366-8]|uniref:Uncharacterized protein n=1 Tax=Wickerhamomyces anomalus (strain ATCC 58044 / CBS 1984 / NCYC 433 / NRRL Y-366-8) TaxID=683960 RepID=A0A1E3NUM4_WICAA|nr:uncharacterized protein WICANDRAFT_36961 [Wickerhamomyces anomalus NRRL Y-366-8]ODQ56730.1 hypothetical protein WICANDRAFT_36961 [Wickerhamomyces anomalus NRRL Y-366-8]